MSSISEIPRPRVFVSHSSKDKVFVRMLVADLQDMGLDVWFDEAELDVGDSIVSRISAAIRDTNYLIVVLSKNSAVSPWVDQELNAALMRQLSNSGMMVLPIRIDDCEVPTLLADRVYADVQTGYKNVLQRLGRVFKLETDSPQVAMIDGGLAVLVPPEKPEVDMPVGTGFAPGPNRCPETCKRALKNIIGHDLRRLIQSCLQLKQLRITWHAVFGDRLEDMHPNADLPTAAFEMVVLAKDLDLMDTLKAELCSDYAAFFNAKCK